jgi:hypothetical protein
MSNFAVSLDDSCLGWHPTKATTIRIGISFDNCEVFIVMQVSDVFLHYTKPCKDIKFKNVSFRQEKAANMRLFLTDY